MNIEINKMSTEKRFRNPNFINDEKTALLEIIKKYKTIIENKRTDKVTLREKENAWHLVEKEFNAVLPAGTHRTWNALRTFYDNLKKKTRHEAANLKSSIRATGGGPEKKTLDPTLELTLSVMNEKSVFGLKNSFDSDGIEDKNKENYGDSIDIPSDIQTEDSINNIVVSDADNYLLDWGNYKSAHLKTPVSAKLKTRNKKEICSVINEQTENKADKPNLELHAQCTSPQEKEVPATSVIKNSWISRRRPAASTNTNDQSKIMKIYEEIGELKSTLLKNQIKVMQNQENREIAEHELRKQALELDVKIKQAQLNNLSF